MPEQPTHPIDSGVRIGHVHLKVADIERALPFYRDVLGWKPAFTVVSMADDLMKTAREQRGLGA